MKTFFFIPVAFVLVFSTTLTPVYAQDRDVSKIYKSLEASIVSITSAEGGGSGIVLTKDGMILTNFHVANTPLPQTVEAIVEDRGRMVKKTFTKVTLFKVHAQSDLALLKIEAGNNKFKPARISKSKRDTVAGGTCFAMGYPFVPGQEKPVLTITKGIISAVLRKVEGNPYIQIDAAINPGNSGGALVNHKGVVIGIPTLKFEGIDRVGLAVPLAGLKMSQFIKPENKKGDPQEAARLAGLASRLIFEDVLSFGADPRVVELAIYLQREALALEPNNPEWSHSLASMYYRLKKYPLALAYSEHAVLKSPKNLFYRSLLANCQDHLKQPKKAIANRMACLSIPATGNDQEKEQRENIMSQLVSDCMAHNKPVQAIYFLSWELSSSKKTVSAKHRLIIQTSSRLIPKALIEEIMSKKTGHSLADMKAYAERSPSPPPVKKNTVTPANISEIKSTLALKQTITSKVDFGSGVTFKLADIPPGVVYNEETETLEWTLPPFSRASKIGVLFLLTKADGNEETYIHTITRGSSENSP